MATPDYVTILARVSKTTRQRIKLVAFNRDKTISELILEGLAKSGDDKLAALIQKELEQRKPGRPFKKS